MTRKLLTGITLSTAGLVAVGAFAFQGPASADEVSKRDEDTPEVSLVADDDNDDTNDRDDVTNDVTNNTRDNTRDNTRGDVTNDVTNNDVTNNTVDNTGTN